ncbi:hypothetical protein M1349_03870 [Patescibacteria group bacterium]|nr:hypothetical protein [Patescibacteria group bacterium]
MGKIRVKTIGDEEAEKKEQQKKQARIEAKKAEASSKAEEIEEVKEIDKVETSKAEEPSETIQAPKEEAKAKPKTSKYKAKVAAKQPHSKSYSTAVQVIDKAKTYSLADALETLKKLQRTKFDETVELHINLTNKGVSGQVTLPHGTGKQTRVAIADDKIIADIESGKIEFDILVAEPAMMPKLAKVARVLGPKGLMPNPKNGTVTSKPEDVAKKYAGGQISFKSESKAPVIHLTVGKMSFGEKKLEENIKVIFGAIKKDQIANIILKSTMSPGIKLSI